MGRSNKHKPLGLQNTTTPGFPFMPIHLEAQDLIYVTQYKSLEF